MRRIMLVTAVATVVFSVLPWPAQAKGLEEHVQVAIRGPGLAEPIRLKGEDAFVFVGRSGAFQPKWDVPNLGGDLTPDADLGMAYRAVVTLRCGKGRQATYSQTLFPEASGGLQVLTPPGATQCYGIDAMPGYWPAADELLTLLVSKGLPVSTGEQGTADDRSKAQAVAGDGGSGGSFGAGLAITIALAVALALLGIGIGLAARRRRGTA
jgi:hypothetical protein